MVEINNPETVLDEILYEGEFTTLLYKNGIVELVWNEKLDLVTLDMLKNVRGCLYQFGSGKRMPVYVSTFPFMETTDEAQRYVSTEEAQKFTLANAIQVDNLAKRMMYNFFLKVYGFSIPARAFSDKTAAFEWLLSFK